jgi:hypothetical protein
MPIFRLRCEKCEREIRIISHHKNNPPHCCGSKMSFILGLPSVRSLVTADEYKNKSSLEGIDKMVDVRAKEFFEKHELPRLIAEEGVEAARAKGLVDDDKTPK